ncbi:hypothetical protein SISSUDRAFT_992515 [Sistotremastrum suecicum HHB10207 ss-3]|uniref:Oxidoreductase AflY n=1 Tax=Sistotremastrum suecicum HHB10207 ss-3 TaxID=1314776 RepID=A0A165Z4E0_9AGAM|nr:hypothetical protein SISSUDRAFT_992515 [Sistotremastrum suecicum HHB10207 ss-3]
MSYSVTQGLLSLPGATAESCTILASLLEQDHEQYHCLFNPIGFHNHLVHHLLNAYDLGASGALLQAIFDDEKLMQRLVDPAKNGSTLDGAPAAGDVDVDNWKKWLGDERAYIAYLPFFEKTVAENGISGTLEKYIFAKEANDEGACMLTRAGLIIPDMVAGPNAYTPSDHPLPDAESGLSLLEVLREVYDAPELGPFAYDGGHDYPNRHLKLLSGERGPIVQKLVSRWRIDLEDLDKNLEECLWVMTLILFSCGKKDRAVRMDFFTAHFHTTALLLRPTLEQIKKPEHKVAFLRMWLYFVLLWLIDRGRPKINPELLMSYTATPRPPTPSSAQADASALGNPALDQNYNPWPAMVAAVVHHPDVHVIKVFRSLYFAAHKFGTRGPGEAPGALRKGDKQETHPGILKADGTIFVRAAGMLFDVWGWVTYGESKGYWDRSGLGWEEAWKLSDDENEKKWKIVDYSTLEEAHTEWNS